ncbi:hypothetical protein AB0M39_04170 [Streptomyces sp. NPDC051907]|uniref:hypothetical protein n=1 Tax=Streptomyces sp. NPDC051907 TaxID=3155284 RepID=UPI0034240ED4
MTDVEYVAEVYAGDAATTVYLGGVVAPSRRLALRWLRGQALRCAGALDPDPYAAWIPPLALQPVTHAERDAPAELRAWADDNSHQDDALRQLAEGLAFQFVARDETGWYGLTARPLAVPAPTPFPGVLAHA